MSAPRPSLEQRIREIFLEQSRACGQLGSPFMEQLMALFATRDWPAGAVRDTVLGWAGDPRTNADNPCLRLAGGLHRLALDGVADVQSVYPPHATSDDALWGVVSTVLVREEAALLSALTRAPQTNEVRRAAALLPAFAMIARATRLPLALWEIGCAAGLNLRADRFCLTVEGDTYGAPDSRVVLHPSWRGDRPPSYPIEVVSRRGVDLAPIDVTTQAGRHRLLSYLWPDQPERQQLTRDALTMAADTPADITQADAIAWLRQVLSTQRAGVAIVLFHTVAWQYLAPEARAEGDALIEAAGRRAPRNAPLFRVSMESDGKPDAALTLTSYHDMQVHTLARVDFHGRSVTWLGPIGIEDPACAPG